MNRSILATGACALVGLVGGLAWPPPPIPRSQLQEPEWTLPSTEQVKRYSAEAYESTVAIRWNGESTQSDTGANNQWVFSGTLSTPAPVALITLPNDPPRHVRVEEPLPDGSKLVSVNDDKITTRAGTCERVYQLHRLEAVQASPGCSAASEPNIENP